MQEIDNLHREIIQKIIFYLSLRDIFAFGLTNHRYFELIKNMDVEDPYLSYILLSMSRVQPKLSELELRKISEKNNNQSIIVKYGKKITIYHFPNFLYEKINSEKLPKSLAKYLLRYIKILKPNINGYRRIHRLEENEHLYSHNSHQVSKQTILWVSFKKNGNGSLHVIGHHPVTPIDTILPPNEAHYLYRQLPNVNETSKNLRIIYNILKKCGKILTTPHIQLNLISYKMKWEIEANEEIKKLSNILIKYAASIKFKNILKENTERKLRAERINELSLKHTNSLFNRLTPPDVNNYHTLNNLLKIFTYFESTDLMALGLITTFSLTVFGIFLTEIPIASPSITVVTYVGSLFYSAKKTMKRFRESVEIEKLEDQNKEMPNPFI